MNFQIYNNNFLGDISSWVLTDVATPNLRFFQIHLNSLLTGDLSSWNTLPASLDSLLVQRNNHYGDLSSWVLPDYANSINLAQNNFTGDL